jgi:hypothetical protein
MNVLCSQLEKVDTAVTIAGAFQKLTYLPLYRAICVEIAFESAVSS